MNPIKASLAKIFKPSKTPTDRKVYLFLFLSIFYIVSLFSQYELIKVYIEYPELVSASSLEIAIPLILFPIGIILFYQEKKFGWIILSAFATYNIVSFLISLVEIEMMMRDSDPGLFTELASVWSPYQVYVVRIVIWTLVFIYLNRKKMKEHFQVSRSTQYMTGIFALIFTVFLWRLFG